MLNENPKYRKITSAIKDAANVDFKKSFIDGGVMTKEPPSDDKKNKTNKNKGKGDVSDDDEAPPSLW